MTALSENCPIQQSMSELRLCNQGSSRPATLRAATYVGIPEHVLLTVLTMHVYWLCSTVRRGTPFANHRSGHVMTVEITP